MELRKFINGNCNESEWKAVPPSLQVAVRYLDTKLLNILEYKILFIIDFMNL